jgi:protocatechuate 3,4-dioxygenase beta subunit
LSLEPFEITDFAHNCHTGATTTWFTRRRRCQRLTSKTAADPVTDWGPAHEEIEMQSRKINRRELIGAMGAAAGAAVAFGCGSSPTSPTETTTTTTTTTGTNSACAVTPTETVGPYPSLTDLFRSDIREGKSGTQLTLTVKVVNVNSSCAAVSGANVEIWHVDAAGNYSQYGTQTTQTYLRGIQTTNSSGEVTFTTIYPGWYQGRATHIHLEVTINGRSVKVTQIAFPESINNPSTQPGPMRRAARTRCRTHRTGSLPTASRRS